MHIYLVGGAVRDKWLGQMVMDRDYVVTGARPEDLLALGYKPVGKDFPVFLHPDSGEAYALARTERKRGYGYHGFVCQTDPCVTLEQDLSRRDLTINAIAEEENGALIDPFGGVRDLKARVLRHVSPAFVDDPLRLLRVARFLARLAPLGFTVANETMALLRQMAGAGEINYLLPERVWAETRKALGEAEPSAFLRLLREVGALCILLPEVDALYGVPQRADVHPEIDTGRHVEMTLDAAARLMPGDDEVAFCALTHDLGKALTPKHALPHHQDHEQRGIVPLRALAARLKVPTSYVRLATLVCRHHLNAHRALELNPSQVLELLVALNALHQPERLDRFLAACMADYCGRHGFAHRAYPQADYLRRARRVAAALTAAPWVAQGWHGPIIGKALKQARMTAIAALSECDHQ